MTRKKHEQNNITQRSKVKRGEEFLVWRSNWETESQLSMRKVEEMKNTCADNGWKAPKCCCRGHYIERYKKWDLVAIVLEISNIRLNVILVVIQYMQDESNVCC